MHELALAMEVVDIVTERARGARVSRVVLEVGVLAAVLPDALRFCFDIATSGTGAAGAELAIVERKALARCRVCGEITEPRDLLALCGCGSGDFEWLSGSELKVAEMEVSGWIETPP